MKQTPFLRFWAALNEVAREAGNPEPTFGPAHRAWERACRQALGEAFAKAWAEAGRKN